MELLISEPSVVDLMDVVAFTRVVETPAASRTLPRDLASPSQS
jgi:hypothetical protein